MADLYKGIEGSPITYLAADISAGQTTISIADDTALPDAPNIATIGFGENVETIKYGQKSNGVLQEVVRGVEGIPRAWQAGTEVARFFTAYDHNSIIENFNAHLADYADNDVHDLKKDGAIIVESYTSGSIFVTKYANGKMELFGRVRNINGENTEITFPEPFYGNTAPIVLATARRAGGYNDLNVMIKSYSTTTDAVQFYVTRTSGELPSGIDIDYMAIGKWK